MKLKIVTKDISIVAGEEAESKAFTATEYIEKFKGVAEELSSMEFSFKIHPIHYTDPNKVLIITGTGSKPKGISESEDDIVVFLDSSKAAEVSFPHKFTHCVSMKELKASIKKAWPKVDKEISEGGDFKSLGVVAKIEHVND